MEKQSKEIDVLALVFKVIKDWKILAKFVCFFTIVGVVVALATPKEYTAEVILAPELSAGGVGLSDNLADLASNFGVDLGSKSSMDAIYPELYPDVFSSTDFLLGLFNVPVRLKDDSTERTYLTHLLKDQKTPFWQYPQAWISALFAKKEIPGKGKSKTDKYRLTKIDADICKGISGAITCIIDKKTSEIAISVKDQDPMVAAILADTLQMRLQNYITNYRTRKARNDYEYYHKLMIESKKRYEKAQHLYAGFADSNTDVILQSVNAKRDDLENEMQLQYNVYNQMAAQMKQAEAKIQERTPAFTIIQNAYMPVKPSSRSRSMTVLLFIIFGVICDAGWILLGRKFWQRKKMYKVILS